MGFLDARQVVIDALWASAFAANIHFAQQGVYYFAQDTGPSPLQHYWSLAVEEQFYVVWPLLLFGLPRRSPGCPAPAAGPSSGCRARAVLAPAAGRHPRLAGLVDPPDRGLPDHGVLLDLHPRLGARRRRPDRAGPAHGGRAARQARACRLMAFVGAVAGRRLVRRSSPRRRRSPASPPRSRSPAPRSSCSPATAARTTLVGQAAVDRAVPDPRRLVLLALPVALAGPDPSASTPWTVRLTASRAASRSSSRSRCRRTPTSSSRCRSAAAGRRTGCAAAAPWSSTRPAPRWSSPSAAAPGCGPARRRGDGRRQPADHRRRRRHARRRARRHRRPGAGLGQRRSQPAGHPQQTDPRPPRAARQHRRRRRVRLRAERPQALPGRRGRRRPDPGADRRLPRPRLDPRLRPDHEAGELEGLLPGQAAVHGRARPDRLARVRRARSSPTARTSRTG